VRKSAAALPTSAICGTAAWRPAPSLAVATASSSAIGVVPEIHRRTPGGDEFCQKSSGFSLSSRRAAICAAEKMRRLAGRETVDAPSTPAERISDVHSSCNGGRSGLAGPRHTGDPDRGVDVFHVAPAITGNSASLRRSGKPAVVVPASELWARQPASLPTSIGVVTEHQNRSPLALPGANQFERNRTET
jgi:hypothetical protein